MQQNPHVLLTFDKVHNPLRLPHKMTSEWSKSAPCPQALTLLNHFRLGNLLRATTACTLSTSDHPKVAQTSCGLHMLTSKCVSPHNGVHFFDISTSKSRLKLKCFVHFHLDMCFAPQRRAIFHVSSGQMAPHPPLSRAYFYTLRSHKALENIMLRDFPTFSRTCIFFLLTFSSLIFFFLIFSSLIFFSKFLLLFPSLPFIWPYCPVRTTAQNYCRQNQEGGRYNGQASKHFQNQARIERGLRRVLAQHMVTKDEDGKRGEDDYDEDKAS